MKRVLQSLEMATLGNSGLPQDTRLLFKALRSSGVHDVTGLVIENANAYTQNVRTRPHVAQKQYRFLDQSNYLLGITGIAPLRRPSLLRRVARLGDRIYRTYIRTSRFDSAPFDMDIFADALWRLLFQRSLPPRDRTLLAETAIRYTNLTNGDTTRSVSAPFAPTPRLNTSGYDVAIFPDVRRVQVSPGTIKIVRYHDTIPVTDPDLLGDGQYSAVHFRSLQACAADSHFVCNSSATREALLRLRPDLEPFSHVIPCAVDTEVSSAVDNVKVSDVLRARLGSAALRALAAALTEELTASAYDVRDEVLTAEERRITAQIRRDGARILEKPFRYILMVAALEPKKNIPMAVRAWERVRAAGENIRFILVGGKGWASDNSQAALEPHIEAGAILHMQDVPFIELQALMKHAELVLFPSFTEGFGYPPMEAMCLGTPSVVSDIPAHRAILEDNATFADPYDPQDIAEKLRQVLALRRGAPKGTATEKMKAHLARFSIEAAADQWNTLISSLEPRRQ